MNFAVYRDPTKKSRGLAETPGGTAAVAYVRLTDCDDIRPFLAAAMPRAAFTIVEIHPAQLDDVPQDIDRVSVVMKKSAFRELSGLRQRLQNRQVDITYFWDRRLSVDYYRRMCDYWIGIGVQHFSFYDLGDFDRWQRLRDVLAARGFGFYDRYHACLPGYASPYQKHLAGYGDLYATGGSSRVTTDGVTGTRSNAQTHWRMLSASEQADERLLFALADRDGVALTVVGDDAGVANAVANGLATVVGSQLHPTDRGLWDTVGLLAALRQV